MSDLLIANSAVEKRRMARKNVVTAIFVLVFSLAFISLGKIFSIVGLLGLIYAVYKGFLRVFYAFGFIRSKEMVASNLKLKPLETFTRINKSLLMI